MFKRIIAALCGLVLLLSTAAASGETLYVRTGNEEGREAFRAKHPEMTVEIVSASEFDTHNLTTAELSERLLAGEVNCDTYNIYTDAQDMKAMIDKGLVMDMSSSQIITDAVNRMWPSIRDQVLVDGKIYGVPQDTHVDVLICHKEEFQKAGYSEADVPHSFDEMLDFLEKWIIRSEEEPQSIQVQNMWGYETYNKYTYTQWLVDMLIEQYILQLQYAGEPLRFDDPALAEYLERCAAIGAKLAEIEDFDEPQPTLFENTQARFYWGDVDTWSAVTSIHEGQPRLLKAHLWLAVVNTASQRPELAVEYLEDCVQQTTTDGFEGRYLFTDVKPIKNAVYEEAMRWQSAKVAMATDRLNGAMKELDSYIDMSLLSAESQDKIRSLYQKIQDEETADLRGDLEKWQSMLDHAIAHEYDFSPEQIEDYAKFAPTMFFPAPNVINGSYEGINNLRKLEKRFAKGQIDARQLCEELNRMAEMGAQ